MFVENIDPHGEGLSINNLPELFGIFGVVENVRLLSGVSHAACARPAVLTYETCSAADAAVTELQELYEFRRGGLKVTHWDARAAHRPRGSCEYAKQVRWRDKGAIVDLRADLGLLPARQPSPLPWTLPSSAYPVVRWTPGVRGWESSAHALLQLEDERHPLRPRQLPVRPPSPASSNGTGSLSTDSDENPRAQELSPRRSCISPLYG